MKRGLGLSDKEMGDVFAKWNKGVLDSFLIEITRDVLRFNDDDGTPLVTLIGEAVFARCLSSLKEERGRAASKLDGPKPNFSGNKEEFLENLEQALYASKIISYAQGFMLIQHVRITGAQVVDQADKETLGCQRI